LEGESERRVEIEKEGSSRRGTKTRETKPAMTFGVAEKATIATAGNNRACSDGRSREDKCGGSEGDRTGVWTEYGGFS